MQRNQHSTEFRQQALSKARQRGSRTLESIAAEMNLPLGTLKGWLKTANAAGAGVAVRPRLPDNTPAAQWSAAQRLLALHESHGLPALELAAWCREKGLFEHQLDQWRDAFCGVGVAQLSEQRQANATLRELQGKHDQLERQMRRKDKALAEAAALLVLQKKFQSLVLQQSEGEDK